MAQKLEELPVFVKARALSIAVTAILVRTAFGRNLKLRDQIAAANESILANMAEGFEQSTDASLANYLYIAKGSVAEVVTRLRGVQQSGWMTAEECATVVAQADEVQRMMGGWIKYLSRCGWKDRGRFKDRQARGDSG
jgi:four helix bundle protein